MCCCCLINAAHVQHRHTVESSHRTCSSSLTIFAIVSAIVNDIICRLNSAICIAKWVLSLPPLSLSPSHSSFSLCRCPRIIAPHCLNSFACRAHLCGATVTPASSCCCAMYLCAACTASYATTTTTAGVHLCSMTTATSSWQHGRGQSLAGINARPTFQCQPSAQRYQSSC